MKHKLMILIIFAILLTGCMDSKSTEKETDYEATKKIVVDILQTEDGRKAIQDVIHDDEMKKELVIQADIVKQSLNDLLNEDKGMKVWAKFFEDPTFVESFVKSTEESQTELYKKLMNDPHIQKQLIELLQNPEMTSHMISALKSQQFREHVATIIEETIRSPLFLVKIEQLLLKAAEEKSEEDESSKKEKGEDKKEEENS